MRKGCIRRWKSQFLTLDNHFAWKGCAWRFKMGKVAILHQFLNVCIWREKTSVFPQLLRFDFHATLASEPSKSQFYTNFWRLTLRGCAGSHQICILLLFGCPTCAISAEGCRCPKEIHIPPHAWAFETHDLQMVAAGKEVSHFATRLGVRRAAEGNVS